MSETERLRKMLDERGIEWYEAGGVTFFETSSYDTCYSVSEPECGIVLDPLTPEQVIAVTVGRGTCHDVGFAPYFFECSECGKVHLRNAAYVDMPNYCPNCGRKVCQ